MKRLRNCWHICTNGLKDRLLFRDREDFIQGMNAVAICSYRAPVALFAFCLMDNHVHFVVNGSEENCWRFVKGYVLRMAKWINRKYGERSPLRGIGITVKPIDDVVYLRDVISYVHRNPMVAGMCAALNYEWSTAGVYFKRRENFHSAIKGQSEVGGMLVTERRCRLRTKFKDIPSSMLVNVEDMILPESYILLDQAERLFSGASGYMFSTNTNQDAGMELALASGRGRAFDDATLRTVIPGICDSEFGKNSIDELVFDERCALVDILKKRYGAGVKQLARVTGVKKDFLEGLFGRK